MLELIDCSVTAWRPGDLGVLLFVDSKVADTPVYMLLHPPFLRRWRDATDTAESQTIKDLISAGF